jgi:phenylacetic acid degradation operon negative regulatory protein
LAAGIQAADRGRPGHAVIVRRVDEQLRRRSVGAPAARSALLTLLGEYVAADGRPVYRDTLVTALEALGYRNGAARQAIVRSVAAGWMTSAREGRRSRMALTPQAREMLLAGAPRIYGFGEPWVWDGRWLLLIVRVSEERREVRDRLRTTLAWAGFGSLGGGLWISPHVDRGAEVRSAVDGAAAAVLAFSAHQLDLDGETADIVSQAWDLGGIAEQYEAFIRDFADVRPASPRETFAAQLAMVHAWRKFPFVDPDLPRELLPAGWPHDRALGLFRSRHERWQREAAAYFRSLQERRGTA